MSHTRTPEIKDFSMRLPSSPPAALALALAALLAAPGVQADAGHDHGAAAPETSRPGLPRFAAASETFELVGVVDGTRLTLYLDRSADNSPVKGAKLELELGGSKIDVKPSADAEFEATLGQPLKPGVTTVTAAVTAGAESDLLAGEINIAAPAQAQTAPALAWRRYAGWTAAGLTLLAALAWIARRALRQRAARAGGAA